jgi:hypothetical protein
VSSGSGPIAAGRLPDAARTRRRHLRSIRLSMARRTLEGSVPTCSPISRLLIRAQGRPNEPRRASQSPVVRQTT